MPINAVTDAATLDNLEKLAGMAQRSVNPPMKKMETWLGDMPSRVGHRPLTPPIRRSNITIKEFLLSFPKSEI